MKNFSQGQVGRESIPTRSPSFGHTSSIDLLATPQYTILLTPPPSPMPGLNTNPVHSPLLRSQ